MQALVKTQTGSGFMELREVPDPSVGPRDVMIKVKAAGICGTDLHIRSGGFYSIPPVIVGHEFAGEIVEIGTDVQAFSPGDRVVAEPHRGGCGTCRYCLTGHVEVCSQKRAIGYKVDGIFALLTSLPETSLHRIPDNVSFEHAALSEPMAVCVKAVLERSTVEPQDFVVVLGCGPIGLLSAAVAKAQGARAVMITGTDRDEAMRLPAARAMGIDHTINVQKEDAAQRVLELTDGVGADLVVEASGAQPAIQQAIQMVRIDGRITGLGITGRETVAIPYDDALKKTVHLEWSLSSTWTSWVRTLQLLGSGQIDVSPIITTTMPLDRWEEAFDLLEKQEAIKILLIP